MGVGFIGSGFNARFHMQSWTAVLDADVLGVWSPNAERAGEAAAGAAAGAGLGPTPVGGAPAADLRGRRAGLPPVWWGYPDQPAPLTGHRTLARRQNPASRSCERD